MWWFNNIWVNLLVFIGYSRAYAGSKVTKAIITKLRYTTILVQNATCVGPSWLNVTGRQFNLDIFLFRIFKLHVSL
jgi:hypothetical protein